MKRFIWTGFFILAIALLPACGSADDPAGGPDVDVAPVTPEVAAPTDTPDAALFEPTMMPTELPPSAAARDVAEVHPCVQEYRRMLIGYDGDVPFSTEVAYELSEFLKESRPECVEQGWNPFFAPDAVCSGGFVAEIRLSSLLTGRQTSGSKPHALPTSRDSQGDILVHFTRLPLRESSGCWHYRALFEDWGWAGGGISGVDRPAFPVCDGLLKDRIASLLPHEFSHVRVDRLIQEIRQEFSEECASLTWSLRPVLKSHRDCGLPLDTGMVADGTLVVNWDREYRPSDNSVCWVLRPGSDAWEFYYRQR